MRRLRLVFAGGFCGAITRYLLDVPLQAATRFLPGAHASFPYDTLLINLTGALVIGLLFGLMEHGAPVSPDARLVLATGFLGAYTTFSSYMVGADLLVIYGQAWAAALYVVGSMVGGITLAYVGSALAGVVWSAWWRHGVARMRAARRPVGAMAGDTDRRGAR